jgi:nitrate reductase delta subunit
LRIERAREKRGDAGRGEAATAMLQSFEKRPEYIAALDRVKAWTRERFKLPADTTIFVAEVSCALPGCPPRETVVAFWTDNDTRHQFKVFKPVAEVVLGDLPPVWLKTALVVDESVGWECC